MSRANKAAAKGARPPKAAAPLQGAPVIPAGARTQHIVVDLSVPQIRKNGGNYNIDINGGPHTFPEGSWEIYIGYGVFAPGDPGQSTIIPAQRTSDRTLNVTLYATSDARPDVTIVFIRRVAGPPAQTFYYQSDPFPNYIV